MKTNDENMYTEIIAILQVQDEIENLDIVKEWIEMEGLTVVYQKVKRIQRRTEELAEG